MYFFLIFLTPPQLWMNKFVNSTDKYDGDIFFMTVDGVKVRVCIYIYVYIYIYIYPSTTMSGQVRDVDRQIRRRQFLRDSRWCKGACMYIYIYIYLLTPPQLCVNKIVKSTDKLHGDYFFAKVDGIRVRVGMRIYRICFYPTTISGDVE